MLLVGLLFVSFWFFFFNDTATTEIYTLSLHDALPISFRRSEVFDTDADGNFLLEGLPRLGELQMIALEAFRAEKGTGEITACSDLGKQRGDIKPYADLKTDVQPMRAVVFACEEFPLVGLYDPRFLQNLSELLP